MKNKERYINELVNIATSLNSEEVACDFTRTYFLKSDHCSTTCATCMKALRKWLEEEYIELSEDEITILRNIPSKYKYLVRTTCDNLALFSEIVYTDTDTITIPDEPDVEVCLLTVFEHIFKGLHKNSVIKISDYIGVKEGEEVNE